MGSICFFSENHLTEVCPLSRGMIFQSLSVPLQHGIRFLRSHLPAGHSAIVTSSLPPPLEGGWETYGFTKFRKRNFVRFRTRLSTGGATSVWPLQKQDQPAHSPFWPWLISIREPILRHDGYSDDSLTLSMSVSLTVACRDARHLAILS